MKTLVLIIGLSVLLSCQKHKDLFGSEPIMCTEMYAMVTIQVEKDGDLQVLTDHYTIDLDEGDTIREEPMMTEYYVVLSDSYQKNLMNNTRNFLFEGYIDDEKVVSENFTITADNCHIHKVSGVEKVIL